jgi:hypothetical protein
MQPIPEELRRRPFTRAEAARFGVSSRMLDGPRFERVYPRVWRAADHQLTKTQWVEAARLALPDRAQVTGLTRLQLCGLELGPPFPIRFVIQGDHHLAFERVFLHRTKKLPPLDDVGVTVAAAFIAFCARARVIDAIKAGDWLLRHGHMNVDEVRTLALAELWRPGSDEAIWVLPHLDGRSRSLPESELRAIAEFAGLPTPDVNLPLELADDHVIMGDLLYRKWRTVVEYEGAHHQLDRAQYSVDIDRYELMRDHLVRYVQVTKERLRNPRLVVTRIHQQLANAGYAGPPPHFGYQWELLFCRLSVAVGPRSGRRSTGGGPAAG